MSIKLPLKLAFSLGNCVDDTPTDTGSLNGSFMEDFMTLNIINFDDVARREKNRVL